MPLLLLTIFLTISASFAGLEKISVQNLNLDYLYPRGKGDIEKLNVNLSFVEQSYPVEVERVEDTYVMRTPMVDFIWTKPWTLAKNINRLMLEKFSGTLGGVVHEAKAGSIIYRPNNDADYKLTNIKAKCQGKSKELRIENRMLEDCRQNLVLTIDRLEVPFEMGFLKSLPHGFAPEETPFRDFYLGAQNGEFYMFFLARYVVTAGLRTWGTFTYENNFRTIVLKVNLIKFGVIPVTGKVLNELKKQIKNPSIKIDPPYIRINL